MAGRRLGGRVTFGRMATFGRRTTLRRRTILAAAAHPPLLIHLSESDQHRALALVWRLTSARAHGRGPGRYGCGGCSARGLAARSSRGSVGSSGSPSFLLSLLCTTTLAAASAAVASLRSRTRVWMSAWGGVGVAVAVLKKMLLDGAGVGDNKLGWAAGVGGCELNTAIADSESFFRRRKRRWGLANNLLARCAPLRYTTMGGRSDG